MTVLLFLFLELLTRNSILAEDLSSFPDLTDLQRPLWNFADRSSENAIPFTSMLLPWHISLVSIGMT